MDPPPRQRQNKDEEKGDRPVAMSWRVLILSVVAAGAVAAGAILWTGWTRRAPSAPVTPSAPAAITPGAAPPGPPGASARDYRLDRDLTASAEAFRLYEEGVKLSRRLPLQATSRFRRATMLDPSFAPAHYRLALADTLVSRAAEARTAIEAALDHRERLPEPYHTASAPLSRFITGAFDLAAAALVSALATHPDNPDLHYLAGMISACSCDHFDPNGVIDHFEQVLAADIDPPGVRARLIEAYEMKGMNNWSLQRALEYRARHPDQIEAVAQLGRVRIARGEYGDAIEAADEVIRRGEDVFAHGLAPAFVLAGQHEQVIALYDPEMERTNSLAANVLTHLHAGVNDVWLGRFRQALEHFDRGPEFLPAPWEKGRKALFYLLLGRTYGVQGRLQEEATALEAAQQVAGARPVLEYALGMNLIRAGELDEAQRVVTRLGKERHRSRPGWTEPWRHLLWGEIDLATGQASRAVDELRKAWSLEMPLAVDCIVGHAEAYFLDGLGRAYLAARRPHDALQAFEQIRSLGVRGLHQPEIAVLALYHSGLALQELGRDREAAARLGRFVALWDRAEPPPRQVGDARGRLAAMRR